MTLAARIPAKHLSALAALRDGDAVRAFRDGDFFWVRWPMDQVEVAGFLRPISGVEFFEQRGSQWHRAGRRLPSALQPPDRNGEPLVNLLAPAKFEPLPVPGDLPPPLAIGLTRSGLPRAATAMACSLDEISAWAETATTAELQSVKAVRCENRVLLLGNKLPTIPRTIRYWGERLFIPLGFEAAPLLPDTAILAAIGAATEECAFLNSDGLEIVPKKVFHPLTRAGVRLGTA